MPGLYLGKLGWPRLVVLAGLSWAGWPEGARSEISLMAQVVGLAGLAWAAG